VHGAGDVLSWRRFIDDSRREPARNALSTALEALDRFTKRPAARRQSARAPPRVNAGLPLWATRPFA